LNESNKVRTTVYTSKSVWKKAKEKKINMSQEFNRYLETILFGENTSDLQFEIEQIDERVKHLKAEIISLGSRREELEGLLKEYNSKMISEHELYTKFLKYIENRLKSGEMGLSVDFNHVAKHLQKMFFPSNGLNTGIVQDIFMLVKKDKFCFDDFRNLRKGGCIAK
jgi:predicted  nucleic acid-binding Zn-ribbon protein